MESLFSLESIIPFITLFALELILGIDNVIFISIVSDRLPKHQRQTARTLGLALAVITRLGLLFTLSWVMSLTAPLFKLWNHSFSGRDLILIFGGLFLLAKSTHEIHHKLEATSEEQQGPRPTATLAATLIQIILLDIVFSLDSVITAVGMVNDLAIMAAAILASTAVMIVSSQAISEFLDRHPTLKMLALSFLVLIGVVLLVDGFGQHISKGYIYFAVGFSLAVEFLNIKLRTKRS